MTVTCSLCNHPIRSLIIDKEMALNEILIEIRKHYLRQHPKEMMIKETDTKKLFVILVLYLTLTTWVDVDESEEWLTKTIDEHEDVIMTGLGFESKEEIDEDEIESMDLSEDLEPLEVPQTPAVGMPSSQKEE